MTILPFAQQFPLSTDDPGARPQTYVLVWQDETIIWDIVNVNQLFKL